MTPTLNQKITSSRDGNVSRVNLMTDFSFQKIILCIYKESKTVKQISDETGLSISTTYRKIQKLNKNHLLTLSGDINSENKRVFRYKSKMNTAVREFFTQNKSNKTYKL